ncbi:MAG: hypothetical protein HY869_23365 [Chloroflexi bacterium]|nr:hypothetical protein [Chloroflexota bacterium]
MGRKGVSKRKTKKAKTVSNNAHQSGNSPVQSLVKDKGSPLGTGGLNSQAGSNNKNKKGK